MKAADIKSRGGMLPKAVACTCDASWVGYVFSQCRVALSDRGEEKEEVATGELRLLLRHVK